MSSGEDDVSLAQHQQQQQQQQQQWEGEDSEIDQEQAEGEELGQKHHVPSTAASTGSIFQRDLRVYAASDHTSLFQNAKIGYAGGQVLLVHRPTMRGLLFAKAGTVITQLSKEDVEDLLKGEQFQAKADAYACLGLLSLPTGSVFTVTVCVCVCVSVSVCLFAHGQ